LRKLNKKEIALIDAYELTGSKAESYARVYQDKGRQVNAINCGKVFVRPPVAYHLKLRADALMEANRMELAHVVSEYCGIIRTTLPDILDQSQDGTITLKQLNSLTPQERAAIKSINTKKDGSFKIELFDRLKALDAMGKHLGMFSEAVNTAAVTVNIDLGDTIREEVIELPPELPPPVTAKRAFSYGETREPPAGEDPTRGG